MLINLSDIITKHRVDIRGIIHVGAHYGQEHQEYLNQGVENIVYVEPCREAFQKLSALSTNNINLFNTALADYEGEAEMFTESHNKGQSNSLLKPGTHTKHHPLIRFNDTEKVKVTTLDSLPISRTLYNFLNIDVQGAELMVLRGGRDTLKGIDYIYTEVNREPVYEGCPMIEELDAFLSDFTRVETMWSKWGWGDAFYVRKKEKPIIPDAENIVSVPEKFRKEHPFPYPPDNFVEFERWFMENTKPEEIKGRVYLPVMWTAFYVQHKYGRNKLALIALNKFLRTLDRSKKYFTICQYDDGILNDIKHLDIKIFGMSGGRIDYTLPLICQPHKFKFDVKKDILFSYVGATTHPVRNKVLNEFHGKEGCFVTDKKLPLRDYCEILARSKYVLAPRGYGKTSFRIAEALQYGAIPVYISDHHLIPHENQFPIIIEFDTMIEGMYERILSEPYPNIDTNYIFKRFYRYEENKKIILNNL